ncbi:unnamed protein product [Periconia digitata]|uniref:M6 metalloprotease n=1 Tax=Periconia digitata TaxID=1303443 RepID=A0A9W4U3X7_9PLEO|nr:unnamed protein product [Periconia digitata]
MQFKQLSGLTVLLGVVYIVEVVLAQACRPLPSLDGGSAPSIGPLLVSVIFVDFPDFPAQNSTEELYNTMIDAPDLYKTMSYGKLDLQMQPQLEGFYRMPNLSSNYNYARGLTTEDHVRYINDALSAVGKAVSFEGVNVLYVVPPRGAKEISFSPTAMVPVTAADGTVIGNTVTFGQDMWDRWGFKTVNHETGHTMGLPDLYPYVNGTTTQWVGGFDMMGLISAQSPDYFAVLKWQLGWIDDSQVDCVENSGITTHKISPIEVETGSKKLIMVPIDSTQAILAEVRSTLGIDEGACGTGVLIYQILPEVGSGNGPIRVFDSKPGSGGCQIPTGNSTGGELSDAPYQVGSKFTSQLGVSITILEQEGEDYIVEVQICALEFFG